MDAVSQVLALRRTDRGGWQSTIGVSAVGHVLLVAVVALAPGAWFGTVTPEDEVVMTISLGGPVGPRDGGMTPMGGRPVQAVRETAKVREAVRAPAARTPEMIEPTKVAPKKVETKTTETTKDARGRTPTTGEEVRKGTAVSAAPSVRGQGFGLSSGGGGTGSYLDTANFCCPEYIALMLDAIRANWDYRAAQSNGTALVKYTIQRDGAITAVQVEKSSGYPLLDLVAQQSLQRTRRLQPLPSAFTENDLTVHLVFEYQRQ